jgi:thymidylate synthase (FAD)
MSAVTLRVTRWAETRLSTIPHELGIPESLDPTYAIERWLPVNDGTGPDPDFLAEGAGRACYQAWERKNPATNTTQTYIRHILDIGHESVLSHAQISYYLTGVSRTLTHELIRHRWFGFSQLSQRFVKLGGDLPYVIPPIARGSALLEQVIEESSRRALADYHLVMAHIAEERPNATRKQIAEAARCVLPGMTETQIVVSSNLRGWRDLLRLRLAPDADAEIREVSRLILADLKDYAPATFQDIEVPA